MAGLKTDLLWFVFQIVIVSKWPKIAVNLSDVQMLNCVVTHVPSNDPARSDPSPQ